MKPETLVQPGIVVLLDDIHVCIYVKKELYIGTYCIEEYFGQDIESETKS